MNKNLPRRLRGWNKYIWTFLLIFLIIGWFVPVIGLTALICMLAPVIKAAFTGNRSWCASSCPRGIFNDVILKKISRNKAIPKVLHSKYVKIIFLLMIFYRFYLGISLASSVIDVGLVLVEMVSVTTAITIVLGILYHPRSWCAFCPMGFLSNIVISIKRAWKFNY